MPTFKLLHLSDLHLSVRPQLVGVAELLEEGIFLGDGDERGLLARVKAVVSAGTALAGYVGSNRRGPGILASHNADVLLRLARFAYRYRATYDAVLVSGDLATSGSHRNLSLAFDLFTAKPDAAEPWKAATDLAKPPRRAGATARPTLTALQKPIWIVPGNHDHYDTSRFYLPGGDALGNVFRRDEGNPPRVPDLVRFTAADERVAYLGTLAKGDTALCCVGADFSLRSYFDSEGGVSYLGQGFVPEVALGLLERLTLELSARLGEQFKHVSVIWLVHFPPEFPYSKKYPQERSRKLALLGERGLVEAAARRGVLLMLAGHTHRPDKYAAGGGPEVVCAGSASQHLAAGGNHAYLVEIDLDESGAAHVAARDLRFNRQLSRWKF